MRHEEYSPFRSQGGLEGSNISGLGVEIVTLTFQECIGRHQMLGHAFLEVRCCLTDVKLLRSLDSYFINDTNFSAYISISTYLTRSIDDG